MCRCVAAWLRIRPSAEGLGLSLDLHLRYTQLTNNIITKTLISCTSFAFRCLPGGSSSKRETHSGVALVVKKREVSIRITRLDETGNRSYWEFTSGIERITRQWDRLRLDRPVLEFLYLV